MESTIPNLELIRSLLEQLMVTTVMWDKAAIKALEYQQELMTYKYPTYSVNSLSATRTR